MRASPRCAAHPPGSHAHRAPRDPQTPSRPKRAGAAEKYFVRHGLERSYLGDLYQFLLVARWSHLVGLIACLYFRVNRLFACLYLLGGDDLNGAELGLIGDAFFFSVQTLSTIGYDVMSAKGFYASALVSVEAFFGMLGVAMMSGLMFAKFDRPTSRVLFSRRLLLANRERKPCLMFRMANETPGTSTRRWISSGVADSSK